MGFDYLRKRKLGTTTLEVPLLGIGCVQIAGWPNPITPEQAHQTLEGAWDAGIRFFDTAPLYGIGTSESRLGEFLQTRTRDEYVLATKVGRLVVDAPGTEDDFWHDAPPRKCVFDFSYDGVMRSIDASLERLGVGRIDILHIHDPESQPDVALTGAFRALARLRDEGAIAAVGCGMNHSNILIPYVQETDFDCFLLAGRYTLLDHASLDDLMPLCTRGNVSIIIGGVFNSGVLIDPSPQAYFDYLRLDENWRGNALKKILRKIADHETGPYWLDRALRIKAICDRHAVPLPAAALQFSAAHQAVASIVVGTSSSAQIRQNIDLLARDIPAELWADLKAEGLLAEGAPTP